MNSLVIVRFKHSIAFVGVSDEVTNVSMRTHLNLNSHSFLPFCLLAFFFNSFFCFRCVSFFM